MDLNNICQVTNGQQQVLRISGDPWDNLLPGAILTVAGNLTLYAVAAITPVAVGQPPGQLFLTVPYGGTTNGNANCVISMDFTPNKDLPLINTGDITAAALYNRAMMILDEESLNILPEHGPTHRPKGADPTPYTDAEDGGIWPAVTGSSMDVLTGDVACTSISLVSNRMFNALGNSTFEVDQRISALATAGVAQTFMDRWGIEKSGSMGLTAQHVSAGLTAAGGVPYPGSSNLITNSFARITVTTAEGSLGAGDYCRVYQLVEGTRLRELLGPHSVMMVVRCSIANVACSVALRDPTAAHSLTQLVVIPLANVWTTVQLQNLSPWTVSGSFTMSPGVLGYRFDITLAAGSTYTAPANGVWNTGNYLGANGSTNFAANTAGATFDIAFVQHQPGVVCSYPSDIAYNQNLEDCTRYWTKSHPLLSAPGATVAGGVTCIMTATGSQVVAPVQFARRMINAPTILGYNPTTGSVNTVQGPSTPQAITGVISASEIGFGGFSLSTPAVAGVYNFHYTADTGF